MSSRLKGRSPLAKGVGFLEEYTKDEIKAQVDIVSLMSSCGIHLEKKGSSWMGLCPFHEDQTPSLSVDASKGLFNCFGCGEGGDVFDFVMRHQHTDFPGALKYLKEFSGSVGVQKVLTPKTVLSQKDSSVQTYVSGEAKGGVDLSDITGFYRRELSGSLEAVAYLKKRGLFNLELIEQFNIGYCAGRMKERISESQKKELKKQGILNSRGYEHFSGCITVPLSSMDGQVVSLYGRRIGERKPSHLYMKGPHQGLLNPGVYRVHRERVIWSESIIDALSLMVLGFPNVDALYGSGGLSPLHIQAVKESGTAEIVLALDNDKAGREASLKLAGKLREKGIACRIIHPPVAFKDWNDVLLQPPQEVKKTIESLITESTLSFSGSGHLTIKEQNGRYTAWSGEITYTVIGVKEGVLSSMKVNIRACFKEQKYIDNVDLFSARSRMIFAVGLSRVFSVDSARIEKDLINILEYLENTQLSKGDFPEEHAPVVLSPQEKEDGLSLLEDKALFERIEKDLEELGYVGERVNKRLMYIAASSRKMDSPISIILSSQSASGKSYLIDTVKKLMPPEDVVSLTSLSDQALNYMEEEALIHKFLTLGEAVHSEAVEYQLREMLSGGELSRLVTVKDEKSGRMVSRMVRKKVIVSLAMSTTSNNINQENASRSFLISSDETQRQTDAIHKRQREKYSYENYRRKEQVIPAIIARHQAAQRLLKPKKIINPFAPFLEFPSSQMRTRRDHERFIDLIAAVCFLRQYQKQQQLDPSYSLPESFIACDLEDYRIAHELMKAILPSTLGELPSSARMIYQQLKNLINKKAAEMELPFNEVWVTQRELRESSGLGHDLIKKNLRLLSEWEYLKMRGSARGARRYYGLWDMPELSGGNHLPSAEQIMKRMPQAGPSGADK